MLGFFADLANAIGLMCAHRSDRLSSKAKAWIRRGQFCADVSAWLASGERWESIRQRRRLQAAMEQAND